MVVVVVLVTVLVMVLVLVLVLVVAVVLVAVVVSVHGTSGSVRVKSLSPYLLHDGVKVTNVAEVLQPDKPSDTVWGGGAGW